MGDKWLLLFKKLKKEKISIRERNTYLNCKLKNGKDIKNLE